MNIPAPPLVMHRSLAGVRVVGFLDRGTLTIAAGAEADYEDHREFFAMARSYASIDRQHWLLVDRHERAQLYSPPIEPPISEAVVLDDGSVGSQLVIPGCERDRPPAVGAELELRTQGRMRAIVDQAGLADTPLFGTKPLF